MTRFQLWHEMAGTLNESPSEKEGKSRERG